MSQPFLSDEMKAGRISYHGKITDLTNAFKLKNGQFFSIFIIPTDETVTIVEANVRLYHESSASAFPFCAKEWASAAVVEIPALAIDLTANAVYWGASEYAEPEV